MRRYDVFQNLIKAKVQGAMLKEAYEVLGQAYEALNRSHETYINLVYKVKIESKGDFYKDTLVLVLAWVFSQTGTLFVDFIHFFYSTIAKTMD